MVEPIAVRRAPAIPVQRQLFFRIEVTDIIIYLIDARMAELVDALDLKSSGQ